MQNLFFRFDFGGSNGLGHAKRSIAIINKIYTLNKNIRITICSTKAIKKEDYIENMIMNKNIFLFGKMKIIQKKIS